MVTDHMPFLMKSKVDGLDDLLRQLRVEKPKAVAKAVRRGVTKVGRGIAKTAKQRAAVRTNAPRNVTAMRLLRKSIGSKVKTYKSGVVVAIVGPRKGFKKQIGVRVRGGAKSRPGDPIYADPVKYARLVELGTRRSKAQPFLRPALDTAKESATETIAAELRVELTK